MPADRAEAEADTVAVTLPAPAPGLSEPLVDETFSHADVFTSVQESELLPPLVREKTVLLGVNGPPAGPEEVKPCPGLIQSGSAAASNTSCAMRIPEPELRSGPGAPMSRPEALKILRNVWAEIEGIEERNKAAMAAACGAAAEVPKKASKP